MAKTIREEILSALKEYGAVTKKDVKKIVDDALHVQLAEFNEYIIKPQLEKLGQKLYA